MTVREILEAIRALPRSDQLAIAQQLSRELVEPVNDKAKELGPYMQKRGRLLVYTGPLPDAALDHRAAREERIDELISRYAATACATRSPK